MNQLQPEPINLRTGIGDSSRLRQICQLSPGKVVPALPPPAAQRRVGVGQDCLKTSYALMGWRQTKRKVMWQAFKNVSSGTVHAVLMPSGMSPHGYAMDWALVETDEPLTCRWCLIFAYEWRRTNPALNAMLPAEMRCGVESKPLPK
jgi:hypothetical protein